MKAMNAVHRLVLRISGGRVGRQFDEMPVVELTTVGRRTGEPRRVLLTAPLREGAGYVVVASRGGDDRNPAWLLNLRDRPEVEVAVRGGPRQPMRARIAGAEDRARMWPQITERYPHYAGYQRRTAREIPLVVLEPAS